MSICFFAKSEERRKKDMIYPGSFFGAWWCLTLFDA
jgi:hypothetical protein